MRTEELVKSRHASPELHALESIEDIDRYRVGWERLADASTSPMQHFGWCRAAGRFYGERDLRVLVLGPPDAPEAIAPLARRKVAGVPRFEFLGSDTLGEPMDFIVASPEALRNLIELLPTLGGPFRLTRLARDSEALGYLKSVFGSGGAVVSRPQPGYTYVALDDSWAEPQRKLSSRRRSDLARSRRRAERLGAVECEVLTPEPAELASLLSLAFDVESRSWKAGTSTALKRDESRGAFFRDYCEYANRRGLLRIGILKIGGRPAACQIAVQSGGAFWLLKVGYDAEFSRCSPGNLLVSETLRYAALQGLQTYEFLGTSESWTRVWSKEERAFVSVYVYPKTAAGAAAFGADLAVAARRRLSRKTR